jgi:catechol 2,3-dioxygenase-like lactoylglutathione lyase family enzyme
MAPELRGLRTVIYPSPDLARATSWWSNFLGFAPYFDEPFYVGFNVGGYELGLVPDGDPASAITYWGVDDVDAAMSSAVASGAEVREAAHDVGDGIVIGSVTTPLGSLVGFIHNPHFSAAH